MDKVEYLLDLYSRSYEMNNKIIIRLFDLNVNDKYLETLENLIKFDDIVYSDLGSRYVNRLKESDKNIDKVIAKLECSLAELERIEINLNNEHKYLLN